MIHAISDKALQDLVQQAVTLGISFGMSIGAGWWVFNSCVIPLLLAVSLRLLDCCGVEIGRDDVGRLHVFRKRGILHDCLIDVREGVE